LKLGNEGIAKLLGSLEKQSKALKDEALHLVWFMRGGLSYSDAMQLSAEERELINGLVKDNMETTKKSGLPFF
jgi:hypothetical protein